MARRYKRDGIGRFAGGSGGTASLAKQRAAKHPTGPSNQAPTRISPRTAKARLTRKQQARKTRNSTLKAVGVTGAVIGARAGIAVYQGGKGDRQQASIKRNIVKTMVRVSGKKSRRTGAYNITNFR